MFGARLRQASVVCIRRSVLSLVSIICLSGVTFHVGWAVAQSQSDTVRQPRVVIIIDDIGNSYEQGLAAVNLPGPVTYAVLPFSAHGKELATIAHQRGKELMLHAPMSNTHHFRLGPGALTDALGEQEFKRVLNRSLDDIPFAIGLNNHMGSLLTQKEEPMRWVMQVAKKRNLFFVDSRTTAKSIAWEVARATGVPTFKRDIFLDHQQTREFLQSQFFKAIRIARQYGQAIMIGHPYPITTEFLAEAIPVLDEAGVQLVSVSALLMMQHEQRRFAQTQHSECDSTEGYHCQGNE